MSASQHDSLQVVTDQPNLRPVTQTTWLADQQREDASTPPAEIRLSQAQSNSPNFFTDPFGDDQPEKENQSIPATAPQGELLFPPPADRAGTPTLPGESAPRNDLRSAFDQLNEPAPTAPRSQARPSPRAQPLRQTPEQGDSLGEILRDNKPDEGLKPPLKASDDLLPVPGRGQADRNSRALDADIDRQGNGQSDSPFDRLRNQDADKADRDRLNAGKPEDVDPVDREDGVGRYDDSRDDLRTPSGLSCTDFRQRIEAQTIDQVSLDISPPYRPDEIDPRRYERLKADFDEKQSIRQWRSIDGRELASGRLRDLAYEKAIIETEHGTTEELAINRLSEADLGYIAENWGLPKECLLEQVAYTPRTWASTTMTWKASNLCHTPLYFEDVNLERYGHTHGPVLEPIVQSAHFFANIAVLPYKMGVHSPKECQYALGYYRPGNCAPWIVPPVPLSARGALVQGAALTGAFWLIP
jgi:hypothetical protein